MKTEIFKLQRPLFSNDPHVGTQTILAYNKKRTACSQFEMPQNQIDNIFGDKPKVYVYAKRFTSGLLDIESLAEPQAW